MDESQERLKMSDLKTRFRNAISHPLTNIANYPENVRSRLLGAQLTDLIDAVADFVVEHGLISTEWEYAVEETKLESSTEFGYVAIVDGLWTPYLENVIACKNQLERHHQNNYVALTGKHWYTYKVVKRPKALPYVEVEIEEKEK